MVARMVLTAETLQETEVQCLPGLVETHASVTFNVVEDNEYDEDVKYEYEYHDPPDNESLGDGTRPEIAHQQLSHDSEPRDVLNVTPPLTITSSLVLITLLLLRV